jgi:hypothetical protein
MARRMRSTCDGRNTVHSEKQRDDGTISRNYQLSKQSRSIAGFAHSKLFVKGLFHLLIPLSAYGLTVSSPVLRSPVNAFLTGPSGLQHPSTIFSGPLSRGFSSQHVRLSRGFTVSEGRWASASSRRGVQISMNVGTFARQAEVRIMPMSGNTCPCHVWPPCSGTLHEPCEIMYAQNNNRGQN